jgi:hypothetical protein
MLFIRIVTIPLWFGYGSAGIKVRERKQAASEPAESGSAIISVLKQRSI